MTGFLSGLQRLFWSFKKGGGGHEFDVFKHLNVNYSAPREDMVTFKMQVQFLHLVKRKLKKKKPQFSKCP